MKINPAGHVILRRTFSEVDRHCPPFDSSSYVGCSLGCSKPSCKRSSNSIFEQCIGGYKLQRQKSRDKVEDLMARLAGKSELRPLQIHSFLYVITHFVILFEIMSVQRTDSILPGDVALGAVWAQGVSKSLDYCSKRFSSSLRHPAPNAFCLHRGGSLGGLGRPRGR
jgi:hypothetical protein